MEDTSLWILSPTWLSKQGSKLGFSELHCATNGVVQRLIDGLPDPPSGTKQPNHIVQWEKQKVLKFSLCEMLSESLAFGSSYVMGMLCVLSHPYSYLRVWVHMAD